MYRLLIVEDDTTLNGALYYNLTDEGYQVACAYTAEAAVDAAQSSPFDLVILDVTLPDFSGFEVCKRIKALYDMPVVFLTARDLEPDVLEGYGAGGDDYITKPFSMNVLIKKIKVMLDRWGRQPDRQIYDDGNIRLDFSNMTAAKAKAPIILTPLEFRILRLFTANRNQVLSRATLLEKLWDQDENYVDEHALTAAISRIRGKIEDGNKGTYIKTVYGMGYIWTGERL